MQVFQYVSTHFLHNSSSMEISFNILPNEHFSYNLLYKSSPTLFITSLSLGLGQFSSFRTPAILPWTLSNTGVFCFFLRVAVPITMQYCINTKLTMFMKSH